MAAALGVALIGSGLSAAPAQAQAHTVGSQSVLGIELPKLPIIGGLLPTEELPILGGLIKPLTEGSGAVTCTVTGITGADDCNDPIGLIDVVTGAKATLTALPQDGFKFDGWQGCPEPIGATCVVGQSALTGLLTTVIGGGPALSPTALFSQLPCDQLPLPLPLPGCEEPGPDPTKAPDTVITAGPTGTVTATTATFQFRVEPATTQGATFQCQLEGVSKAHGFAPCTTGKAYQDLEPGSYTFKVKAKAGELEDATPASRTWTVEGEDGAGGGAEDTTRPNTFVASGPKNKGWVRNTFASYSLASSEADVTYTYRLNGGKQVKCYFTECDVLNLRVGTNKVQFTASDAADNVDASPVTRYVSVPRNNRSLKHSKGWMQRNAAGHYFRSYSETSSRGASLTTNAKSIKRVALVVTKGKGHGKVKVMLGKKVLKRVSLGAKKTKKKQLIPIKTFKAKKRGTIRVVVISKNKTVRIEGLGIATK